MEKPIFNPTPKRDEPIIFMHGPLDGVRRVVEGIAFEYTAPDQTHHRYERTYVKFEGKVVAFVMAHVNVLNSLNGVIVIAAMNTRRVNQSIRERMLEILEAYPVTEYPA